METLQIRMPGVGNLEATTVGQSSVLISIRQAYADHDDSDVILAEDEARRLRDWLNKVYPTPLIGLPSLEEGVPYKCVRVHDEYTYEKMAVAAAEIPLCGGHAEMWFCERNHLKGGLDAKCVVCAFTEQGAVPS